MAGKHKVYFKQKDVQQSIPEVLPECTKDEIYEYNKSSEEGTPTPSSESLVKHIWKLVNEITNDSFRSENRKLSIEESRVV